MASSPAVRHLPSIALALLLVTAPLAAAPPGAPPRGRSVWLPPGGTPPPGGGVPRPPDGGSPRPDPFPLTCLGSIGDLVVGGAIDPARRAFAMSLLGAGWELRSVALRSEGECDEQGRPRDPALVLETAWGGSEGCAQAWVTQRAAAEPTANVLERGSATFWWQGYAYAVAAPPAADVLLPPGVPAGGPTCAPGPLPPTAEAPGEGGDPLPEIVARLAPGLALDCFHRRVEGGWDDLPGLGIGDPRPALPPTYFQTDLALSFLRPPAAGCAPAPPPAVGRGVAFSAGFSAFEEGWIALGAWSLPAESRPFPGHLDEQGASWANASYQFSVAATSLAGPLGREGILAIARALDPGFTGACLLESRELEERELGPLGFHAARPPAGFTLVSSSLRADEVTPGCPAEVTARGAYSLSWTFADDAGAAIHASAYRAIGGDPRGGATAPHGEGFLAWSDARGTQFNVAGYAADGTALDEALLIEVARSMDPTFDRR